MMKKVISVLLFLIVVLSMMVSSTGLAEGDTAEVANNYDTGNIAWGSMDILELSNDMYALVTSWGPGYEGMLQTYNIPDRLTPTLIETSQWTTYGSEENPNQIIHVYGSSDIYLLLHSKELSTVRINPITGNIYCSGTPCDSVIDQTSTTIDEVRSTWISHAVDNIYASISVENNTGRVRFQTFSVDPIDGTISAAISTKSVYYTTKAQGEAQAKKLWESGGEGIYAVVYRAGNLGSYEPFGINTYSVDSDGVITAKGCSAFSPGITGSSNTAHVSAPIVIDDTGDTDRVIGITFGDSSYNGWIETYSITSMGTLTAIIDSYQFEGVVDVRRTQLEHLYEDIYVAFHANPLQLTITTLLLDDTGSVGPENNLGKTVALIDDVYHTNDTEYWNQVWPINRYVQGMTFMLAAWGNVDTNGRIYQINISTPCFTTMTEIRGVSSATATAYATLDDCGSSCSIEEGFVYGTSPAPTKSGSYVISTTAGPWCPEQEGNTFDAVLTGLHDNTTYYVRAYTITALTTYYSDNELSFNTSPDYGDYRLDLDFDPIDCGATIIEDSSSNDNDATYTLAVNPGGITVLKKAITSVETEEFGGRPYDTVETLDLLDPDLLAEPDDWYIEDPEFDTLIGSELVNTILDNGGVPKKLFWLTLIGIIVVVAGFWVYARTRHLFALAMVANGVVIFFACVGFIGWWLVPPYLLITIAIVINEREYSLW